MSDEVKRVDIIDWESEYFPHNNMGHIHIICEMQGNPHDGHSGEEVYIVPAEQYEELKARYEKFLKEDASDDANDGICYACGSKELP